VFLIYKGVDL